MVELALNDISARRRWRRPRFDPEEGWLILLLHAAVLFAAAWAVSRGGWERVPPSLPFVALFGAIVGLLLAKTSCPDLMAHTIAFITGGLAIVAWTVLRYQELGPTWRDRSRDLWTRGAEWRHQIASGETHADDYLLFIVLGVTFWLVAYMATWTLYRRHWLTAALLLPGFVIVVNLGNAPRVGPEPLVLYLIAAGTLTACHFAHRRQREWSRFGIPAPADLPWRFLSVGGSLVILLVALAWFLPLTSQTSWFESARARLEDPLYSAQDWIQEWGPESFGSRPATTAAYSEFDTNGFSLGGGDVNDTTPLARLQIEGANGSSAAGSVYLVASRYDTYTGHGWEIGDTFDHDGQSGGTYLPQVTFEASQEVILSDSQTGERVALVGRVTIMTVSRQQVFTVDTYLTSDLPVNARLSWLQLEDVTFTLSYETLGALPPDLSTLADLLLRAEWGRPRGAELTDLPLPSEPDLANALVAERTRLAGRFLTTRWAVDEDGAVTMFVTGQIPVYDDIDAVYARASVDPGQTYEVVGLTSIASEAELRQAGSDYPDYVANRYLSLPENAPSAVAQLAGELAADLDNPFDIAKAIEDYLRSNYEYERGAASPPGDRDGVEYFLFESQRGDCEFYASAMIVLLRELGIPARMVTGLAPATYDPQAAGHVYRALDSHAWVEVFFPGYGWTPFEPTPSEPTRAYGATPNQAAEVVATIPPLPTQLPTPIPESADNTPAPIGVVERVDGHGGRNGAGDRLVSWIVAGIVGAGGLAVLAIVYGWRRGLTGMPIAASWFARMVRAGRFLGVEIDPGTTPREYADYFGRAIPAAQRPAAVLADLYSAERYGPETRQPMTTGDGAEAWRSLRGATIRRILRPGRRRRHKPSDGTRQNQGVGQ